MISIITPSVRPELLGIVKMCLSRQTHKDFEWLVVSPKDYGFGKWIKEPPKREGDYYNLNKAWNEAFKHSKGELIVEITDGIWFVPDTLERLWAHYQANPKACITTIGHQYEEIVNGKPEKLVWTDPRARTDQGFFYEINPNDLELCLGSIPRQAVIDVGGVDEEFDKVAALSEKEMALRMDKAGYKFFIDQDLSYRAVKHPRLNDEWEEHYQKGIEYFKKCVHEIIHGDRCHLAFLENSAIS